MSLDYRVYLLIKYFNLLYIPTIICFSYATSKFIVYKIQIFGKTIKCNVALLYSMEKEKKKTKAKA